MDKLKELFFKINAKAPVLRILFLLALGANAVMGYALIDVFTFKADFLILYGLEDAGRVRGRVQKQLETYKPKEPPPPAPPPQMAADVRNLQGRNIFLPPGVLEQTGLSREEKFTDVTGIDLVGTVYSHTPTRRSALIELNGIAMVVLEGKTIRGTQKKVVEIGRSKISIKDEGLLPSPVYLPSESGLDDLRSALADNRHRTESNWDYTAKSGKTFKKAEEAEEGGKGAEAAGEKPGGGDEEKKAEPKKAADEEVVEEEEEEEPAGAQSAPSGAPAAGGGVDLGGGGE